MKRMSAIRGALIASVAMGAMPITAQAQSQAPAEEEAAPADEMVVIGQRQQYRGDVPLASIPQSVQVLDAKVLQDLNITRFESALELTSGIAKQNNFGGLWDAFAVRGFAGDENFPSGFLVNGFNGGRGYGGPRDASNIERIEILKGPNGAVFGRGEPGGTVNIITKKARTDETFGSFTIQGGSWNNYRVEGDYNLALTDTVAIRLNGAAQDGDSFRDTVHQTKYVASPSILFKPTDSTSLSCEMEFVDNKVPFDRSVLAKQDGTLGIIPNSRFLGEPGDGNIHVKVLGHQLQFQQKLSKDWFFLAGFGYRDTSFYGFGTQAELALGRQAFDNDATNLTRQRILRDYNTTNTSVRGELSGKVYTGSITHHVLVGADWDRFHIDLFQTRYRPPAYTPGRPFTAANNVINVFAPVYGQLPAATAVTTDTDEVQKAYGIYFQDQIDLTEVLKVRVGGRFDHFQQDILNRANNRPFSATVKQFSPTAGALYKVTEDFSIYGGYGEGFRPNSGTDFFVNAFPAELSKSYEVGMRFAAPGDAITASVAVFEMKKNNVLTADPNPDHAGFSIAGGAAKSRGLEFDFSANLPGDLSVLASYAYIDAFWTTASADKDFGLTIRPGDRRFSSGRHPSMDSITTNEIARKLLSSAGQALDSEQRVVLEGIGSRIPVSRDAADLADESMTFGDRLADRVAAIGGSWRFIIGFSLILAGWMLLNTDVLAHWHMAFDPYPYIFLNLLLSTLAAIQAPVIMMSQNRQAAKDRVAASHDYTVNLRTEVEIMALHEKWDRTRLDEVEAKIDRLLSALERKQN